MITVTAKKREENVQKVPTAITVLKGADLLEDGIGRSASEILDQVPNASAGTQQHGRPRWWIRGVGAGQQQIDFPNPVGFYLDDVYISNASATGFPLFDLERVEVLRGPQGTLWGKNTTGGAINVISRKPSFKTDAYVKLDYGSYNDRIAEGAIGGAIVDQALAGRFSFHAENQGGPFTNRFTNTKEGGLSDHAFRGQLLGLVSPDFDASLNVHYRDYKTDGQITTVTSSAANGVYRNGYAPSTEIADVDSNAPNWSDTTQTGTALNLRWQLGRLNLVSITGYENFDTESLGDSDYTPLEISRGYNKAKSRQYSQEFRLASPKEDRFNWVTGFHYFDENIDSNSSSARLPDGSVPALAGSTTPVGYSNTIYNQKATSYALFGGLDYTVDEKFDIAAGLRWTTETKELNLHRVTTTTTPTWNSIGTWWLLSSVNGTYGGSGTFTSAPSKTWDAITYDVTPQYKLDEHARVYYKFAHGVKSGGFNTAATDVRALNVVEPETLISNEIGLKSEWLDGRLNFNATLFHYNYKNDQVNVVGIYPGTTTAVSYLQNVAKAHANGAEVEIEALPLENLHLTGSVGLLHTRFDQFDVQNNGGNHNGNEFVRSPHQNVLLGADYSVPFPSGAKVIVGGDARHVSKQFYYVVPQTNPLLNQEPYTLVNARIAYVTPNGKQTLTFYANNVTNTEYHNHALPGAAGVTGAATYWALPRTLGVSLLARW